ncbi:MAG TPA: peptidoglycan-associated lipoprotein Pal [Acetobacteraceae bacterium]|jgi:peptidoglycan-associated lipoprotein
MRSRALSFLLLAGVLAACSSTDNGTNSGAGGAGMGPGGGVGAAGAGGYAAGNAAPGSEEDLVQNVGDRIFYDTDQSTLSDTARTTLGRQVQWLQQHPTVNVLISGNCDDRGTEEYNLALGQRRAVADANFLVAQGVNASRLQTISYGKDRPVDPNDTPDAWAKNRNAITQVH